MAVLPVGQLMEQGGEPWAEQLLLYEGVGIKSFGLVRLCAADG